MDQGLRQGRAAQSQILAALRLARRRAGWFNWPRESRRAKRLSVRPTQWFLPQLSEREEGIANGAAVRPSALALIAVSQQLEASGRVAGKQLLGNLDAVDLASSLLFRRSVPDEVGLESLELTAPAWAGCWGGINEAGVAVLVLEEFSGPGPRAALFAQDLLFRASETASGISHLRSRVRYAGGSGALLIADSRTEALRADWIDGELDVSRIPTLPLPPSAAQSAQLRIDLATRSLAFGGEVASL